MPIVLTPVHEGRFLGVPCKVGWVRRPRASPTQARTRAASGAPPGWPLRAACEEPADDPGKSGRKRGPTPRQERRSGAPEGEHPDRKRCAADAVKQAQTAQACLLAAVGAPLGAPLPSALARGKRKPNLGRKNCIARTTTADRISIHANSFSDACLDALPDSDTPEPGPSCPPARGML